MELMAVQKLWFTNLQVLVLSNLRGQLEPHFVLFQKDFFIIMQPIAHSSCLIPQFVVQLIAQFAVAIGQFIVQ